MSKSVSTSVLQREKNFSVSLRIGVFSLCRALDEIDVSTPARNDQNTLTCRDHHTHVQWQKLWKEREDNPNHIETHRMIFLQKK